MSHTVATTWSSTFGRPVCLIVLMGQYPIHLFKQSLNSEELEPGTASRSVKPTGSSQCPTPCGGYSISNSNCDPRQAQQNGKKLPC